MNNNLIFDLGFHNGDDTRFYLAKGYNVVAVEADPLLVAEGQTRFAAEIAAKRLILINKAVSPVSGETEFFVHPTNPDWSSCHSHIAGSDGSQPRRVKVIGTTLHELYAIHGTPHYLKVDVEGNDVFVARELFEYQIKPDYVSFETSRRDFAGLFSYLYLSGYKSFQLVNQANNAGLEVTISTLQGDKLQYLFSRYSSGLFGEDLPEERWLPYEETLARYMKYKELKQIDNRELGLGWVDVHARYLR